MISRRCRESHQDTLFEVRPSWANEWWGMPSFQMGDARPLYSLRVSFHTQDDLIEFASRLGVKVSTSTDSLVYPPESLERASEWEYCDEA